MLGTAQRTDATADRAVHVAAGAGDDAAGEGGGIEFVLGVQDQRGVHRLHPRILRLLAMQQVQEVATDGVVVGFYVDGTAVVAPVVPVQQHRAEAGHQLVGDVARARMVVVVLFRRHAAEHGHASAHHVHRVRRRRQLFQRRLHRGRNATQRLQLGLVRNQLGAGRQLAVHQQVGDFLELAGVGQVQDVVATVVQIVAAAAHAAQRSVAGSSAGQGDGLLRLEGRGCGRIVHVFPPKTDGAGYCLFLGGEQCIELLLEGVVADAVIQLFARLHALHHIALMAIAAHRLVDIFGGLVGRTER